MFCFFFRCIFIPMLHCVLGVAFGLETLSLIVSPAFQFFFFWASNLSLAFVHRWLFVYIFANCFLTVWSSQLKFFFPFRCFWFAFIKPLRKTTTMCLVTVGWNHNFNYADREINLWLIFRWLWLHVFRIDKWQRVQKVTEKIGMCVD